MLQRKRCWPQESFRLCQRSRQRKVDLINLQHIVTDGCYEKVSSAFDDWCEQKKKRISSLIHDRKLQPILDLSLPSVATFWTCEIRANTVCVLGGEISRHLWTKRKNQQPATAYRSLALFLDVVDRWRFKILTWYRDVTYRFLWSSVLALAATMFVVLPAEIQSKRL